MSIFDKIISTVAPHECLGCQRQGSLLCSSCSAKLHVVPERCYRCRRLNSGAETCASCRRNSHLQAVHVTTDYQDLAKDLVWKLKFEGAQAAAQQIAAKMKYLFNFSDDMIIVPVPTATSRVRSRGYDQAELLARALIREFHMPKINCLTRLGQTHQIGSDRTQRLQQVNQAFIVKKPQLVSGARILLVDDVITTGATLESAARVLKQSGAKCIEALVFAQP